MWALAFIVVVLEKDLGLALVLFSVFVIMLYVATGKKLYLVVVHWACGHWRPWPFTA